MSPGLILFLAAAIFVVSRNRSFKNFFNTKVLYHSPINKLRFDRYNSILNEHLEYYRPLSPAGKAKFITRVHSTISHKNFEGREGMKLTEHHKVLIAGSMVQLTFGMADFTFENIQLIMVFPRQFYSRRIEHDVKGLTSNEGWVALSWEDFEEGYAIGDDKYNLGLHEMAHALKLYAIMEQFDDSFSDKLRNFQSYALGEIHNMREGYPSFLREYASNNLQEFFAVCIENFFEAPDELKKNLEHIYNLLCILLNQDPLNKAGDYKLSPNSDYIVKIDGEKSSISKNSEDIDYSGCFKAVLWIAFFIVAAVLFAEGGSPAFFAFVLIVGFYGIIHIVRSR